MDDPSTDTIRSLSTKWSLAADEKLLNLLQNTHQKIISKCQDASSKLEEMALALDDASINLQNVNNKFMALSNSQFIESRVYDDDSETDGQIITKEPQTPSQTDELTIIKQSLTILDKVHEITEIVDDSDSDSEAEISVVLKPKDLYSHRPLPYIIGSQSWKNKWHAGLILEDSDSDSTISKHEQMEVYSESESDNDIHKHNDDHTISESGSSFTSEQEPTTKQLETTKQSETTKQPEHKTPADIAAELARRLAGPIQVQQETDDYLPPSTKKVYKPEQPVTSTIFSDEPPPLDVQESSSDEDIFAEINKNKPYQQQRNPTQPNLADDLFGFNRQTDEKDIFSDISSPNINPPKQKSQLFDENEPEIFEKKDTQNNNILKQEPMSKKPVGGISLFGSNKESIGAAILRKKRKSSSSDDNSENDSIPNKTVQEKPNIGPKINEKTNIINKGEEKSKNTDEVDKSKKEKDIFEDLFAKPKEIIPKKVIKDVKDNIKAVKEQKNVKELFNDNIFDDIDDIFTNNVVVKETKQKSIFDDEDLFKDIAVPITVKQNNDRKNIFDSDDELFSDLKPKSTNKEKVNEIDSKVNENSKKLSQNDTIEGTPTKNQNRPADPKTKDTNKASFSDDIQKLPECAQIGKNIKTKSIFDSDSDEDIFADIKISKSNENKSTDKVINNQNKLKIESAKVIQSPSLFDEDDDELFASTNKNTKTDEKVIDKQKDKQGGTNQNILKETKIDNVNIFTEDNNIEKDISSNKNIETVINEKDNILYKEEIEQDLGANKSLDTVIINKEITEDKAAKEAFKDLKTVIEKNADDIVNVKNNETQKHINETKSTNDSLFDEDSDNSFEDSTEQTKIESSQDSAKNDFKSNEININNSQNDDVIQNTPKETNIQDNIKEKETNKDTNKEQLKETLESAIKSPISIFDDIFSEPPDFEKPAEPKKSKNVNALFDDDSDDEALFFKKDDVISDVKPEIFSNNANFDIFVNEPPAIDVDFTTKSKNYSEDDLFSPNIDVTSDAKDFNEDSVRNSSIISTDLYKSEPSASNNQSTKNDNIIKADSAKSKESDSHKDLFGEELDKDLFQNKAKRKTEEKSIFSKEIDSDDELFGNITKTSQNDKTDETLIKPEINESPKNESKKIGKLNTKNFNINVNALIPGASPKKIPKDTEIQSKLAQENDEKDNLKTNTDNIIKENKVPEDNSKSDKLEDEIDNLKADTEKISTDFEKTEFLDNNASKQRPRIQVKRRPSTRKARHEAARKSGIDFGENTNLDESTEIERLKTDKIKPNIEENTKNNAEVSDFDIKTTKNAENIISDNTTSLDEDLTKKDELKPILDVNVKSSEKNNTKEEKDNTTESKTTIEDTNKKGSTTKIVYILNDEDIFSTKSNTLDTKSTQDNTKVETSDKNYGKLEKATEINKGKEKDTKSSLFDDSDEELFKTEKKATKKVNIFDSDSEDDLFTGKRRKEKQNEEKRREIGKQSLFDDDDDDLFGAKNEKIESIPPLPSTSKETKKSTQAVFDDPLSMLGED